MRNMAAGAQTIVIDIFAGHLVHGLTASIPQMELLLILVAHVLGFLIAVRFMAYKYFIRDGTIDKVEATELNMLYISGLGFAFVLLRLLMIVSIATVYSSYLPWYQFVAFLSMVFSIMIPVITIVTGMSM